MDDYLRERNEECDAMLVARRDAALQTTPDSSKDLEKDEREVLLHLCHGRDMNQQAWITSGWSGASHFFGPRLQQVEAAHAGAEVRIQQLLFLQQHLVKRNRELRARAARLSIAQNALDNMYRAASDAIVEIWEAE